MKPLDRILLAWLLEVLLAVTVELAFGVGRLAGWWWPLAIP